MAGLLAGMAERVVYGCSPAAALSDRTAIVPATAAHASARLENQADPDLCHVGTLPCFGTESITGPGGRFGAKPEAADLEQSFRSAPQSGHTSTTSRCRQQLASQSLAPGTTRKTHRLAREE